MTPGIAKHRAGRDELPAAEAAKHGKAFFFSWPSRHFVVGETVLQASAAAHSLHKLSLQASDSPSPIAAGRHRHNTQNSMVVRFFWGHCPAAPKGLATTPLTQRSPSVKQAKRAPNGSCRP